MIDQVLDTITESDTVKDKNKQLGERVRKYTLITKYFDNLLRVNYKLMVKDYVILNFMLMIAATYFYNKLILDFTYQENITILKDNLIYIGVYVYTELLNSKVISLLNDFFIIGGIDYQQDKIKETYTGIKRTFLDPNIIYFYFIIIIVMTIYFISIYYQYFSQKQLFNSGVVNMFIPKVFLFNFFRRTQNKYMYMKLIKHQQNKTIYTSSHELFIRNIFFEKGFRIDSKIHLILEPKRFLYFYDYIKVYYTLMDKNNKKIEEVKKEKIEQMKKEKIEQLKQNTENAKGEIMEKMNEGELKELELLDEELFDQLEV